MQMKSNQNANLIAIWDKEMFAVIMLDPHQRNLLCNKTGTKPNRILEAKVARHQLRAPDWNRYPALVAIKQAADMILESSIVTFTENELLNTLCVAPSFRSSPVDSMRISLVPDYMPIVRRNPF